MKKITTIVATAAISLLVLTGCTAAETPKPGKGVSNVQETAAPKPSAVEGKVHWDGYDRLAVPDIEDLTEEERNDVYSKAMKAGDEMMDLAAQWVDDGEVDKLGPLLIESTMIQSVDELDDAVTYRWTVLNAASVCQRIFDKHLEFSTLTATLDADDADVAASTKLTVAVVEVLCAELI